MAHYAQLDENNVVMQVIVIGNDQLKDVQYVEAGGFITSQTVESEAKGLEFIYTLYPADTVWKQTSYNAKFRGKYAAIGDTFDGTNFVSPVVPPAPTPEPTPEPAPEPAPEPQATATTVDSFSTGSPSTVDSYTIGLDQTGA